MANGALLRAPRWAPLLREGARAVAQAAFGAFGPGGRFGGFLGGEARPRAMLVWRRTGRESLTDGRRASERFPDGRPCGRRSRTVAEANGGALAECVARKKQVGLITKTVETKEGATLGGPGLPTGRSSETNHGTLGWIDPSLALLYEGDSNTRCFSERVR
jgi:hypothetical protein